MMASITTGIDCNSRNVIIVCDLGNLSFLIPFNYICIVYCYFTQLYKKLSCRRETVHHFILLSILLSHSRSFEMTLLSRVCLSYY